MAPSTGTTKRAALDSDISDRAHQATRDNTEPGSPTVPKKSKGRAGHETSSDTKASTQTEVLPSGVEDGRARMEMMEMESETKCGSCGHFCLLSLLDAVDVGRRPPALRVPVDHEHRL